MLVVMPEGMSGERVAISRAFGAEVLQVGHFHVDEALAKAKELGQQEGYFCPSQFESEWNVEENRVWLGPEILAQLPENAVPDALVMGVGTGGTLVGVGQAFREVNPDVKLFAMEPSESATILCGEVGEHLFVGPSSGANLIASRKVRETYPELKTVVTLFCDEGEKYIQEHFAEEVQVTSETFT